MLGLMSAKKLLLNKKGNKMPENKIKSIEQIRNEEIDAMNRLHQTMDELENAGTITNQIVKCHIKHVMGCVARMMHLVNKENGAS